MILRERLEKLEAVLRATNMTSGLPQHQAITANPVEDQNRNFPTQNRIANLVENQKKSLHVPRQQTSASTGQFDLDICTQLDAAFHNRLLKRLQEICRCYGRVIENVRQ